jgi:hydrogenase maturation factor
MIKKIQLQLQCFTFNCALLLYFIQYNIKIQILQNSAAVCHFILLHIGHVFKVVVVSNCKPLFSLSVWNSMTPTGEIFVKFDNENFYKNLSMNSDVSD